MGRKQIAVGGLRPPQAPWTCFKGLLGQALYWLVVSLSRVSVLQGVLIRVSRGYIKVWFYQASFFFGAVRARCGLSC